MKCPSDSPLPTPIAIMSQFSASALHRMASTGFPSAICRVDRAESASTSASRCFLAISSGSSGRLHDGSPAPSGMLESRSSTTCKTISDDCHCFASMAARESARSQRALRSVARRIFLAGPLIRLGAFTPHCSCRSGRANSFGLSAARLDVPLWSCDPFPAREDRACCDQDVARRGAKCARFSVGINACRLMVRTTYAPAYEVLAGAGRSSPGNGIPEVTDRETHFIASF